MGIHADVCACVGRPATDPCPTPTRPTHQPTLDMDRDKWVRCVVLAGAGKSFSCGHDLYQMHNAQGNKAIYERMFARCSRFMLSIQRVPQPVIAAVNGLATGAGK